MYISNLSRSLDLRLATVTLQKYGKSELRPLLCFRGKLEGSCTGTETNRRQKMTNIRHRVTSQNNRSPTSHIGLPLWRDCEEITDCSPLYETTREKNSQFSPRSKRYSGQPPRGIQHNPTQRAGLRCTPPRG